MDPLSSAGLAVGGMALDYGASALQNRFQRKAAHEAQDFSAQQYATRYQTQVKDLKAAGLNPMLAYMQSPGSAPSGVLAQQEMPKNISSKLPEFRLATAQAAKIDAETENIKTEKKNIEALQDKLNQEIVKVGNEVLEIDQRIKTGRASEAEIRMRTELVAKEKELRDVQVQLALQEKNIKTPEEIASGTSSAVGAAHVSRALRPIIDAFAAYLATMPKK